MIYAYRAMETVYYAVFHTLRIRANYDTRSQGAHSSHKKFILELKQLSDNVLDNLPNVAEDDIIYIGNELDALRIERNAADYEGSKTFTKREAVDACERAEEIFSILDGE